MTQHHDSQLIEADSLFPDANAAYALPFPPQLRACTELGLNPAEYVLWDFYKCVVVVLRCFEAVGVCTRLPPRAEALDTFPPKPLFFSHQKYGRNPLDARPADTCGAADLRSGQHVLLEAVVGDGERA